MSVPEISVIIPTYNRAEMVVEAVGSVLAQNYHSLECVVVDDGSTDATAENLDRIFGKKVRVIIQENRGVSAARNRGIRETLAPFVAFLDSDDIWLPGKLSSQMEWFAKNPEFLICQTTEQWIRGQKRVNPRTVHLKKQGEIFFESLERCMITPSSVLLKRTLLDNVGLFDESLPACEDYDLWLRVASRHKVGLVQKELLIRRGGRSDQLSALHSLDKYRIAAVLKLLEDPLLMPGYRSAAQTVLARKCRVYANGCLKRGRFQEAGYYLNIEKSFTEKS